jgi:hypothetical protein
MIIIILITIISQLGLARWCTGGVCERCERGARVVQVHAAAGERDANEG